VEGHTHNFVSFRIQLDLGLTSELCQTIGDELFFYLAYLLKVDKTQDLPSKIWQTLGDALNDKTHSAILTLIFETNLTSVVMQSCHD
jgi:hypothetical protein